MVGPALAMGPAEIQPARFGHQDRASRGEVARGQPRSGVSDRGGFGEGEVRAEARARSIPEGVVERGPYVVTLVSSEAP